MWQNEHQSSPWRLINYISSPQTSGGGMGNNHDDQEITKKSKYESWLETKNKDANHEARLGRLKTQITDYRFQSKGTEDVRDAIEDALFSAKPTPEGVIDLIDEYLNSGKSFTSIEFLQKLNELQINQQLQEIKIAEHEAETLNIAELNNLRSNNIIPEQANLRRFVEGMGNNPGANNSALVDQAEELQKIDRNKTITISNLLIGNGYKLTTQQWIELLNCSTSATNYFSKVQKILGPNSADFIKNQLYPIQREKEKAMEGFVNLAVKIFDGLDREFKEEADRLEKLGFVKSETGLPLKKGQEFKFSSANGSGIAKITDLNFIDSMDDQLAQLVADRGYNCYKKLMIEVELDSSTGKQRKLMTVSDFINWANVDNDSVSEFLFIPSLSQLEKELGLDQFGQKLSVGTKLDYRKGSDGSKIISDEVEIKSINQTDGTIEFNKPVNILLSKSSHASSKRFKNDHRQTLTFAEFARWFRHRDAELHVSRNDAQAVLNDLPKFIRSKYPNRPELNLSPIKLEPDFKIDNGRGGYIKIQSITDNKIALSDGRQMTLSQFVQLCKTKNLQAYPEDYNEVLNPLLPADLSTPLMATAAATETTYQANANGSSSSNGSGNSSGGSTSGSAPNGGNDGSSSNGPTDDGSNNGNTPANNPTGDGGNGNSNNNTPSNNPSDGGGDGSSNNNTPSSNPSDGGGDGSSNNNTPSNNPSDGGGDGSNEKSLSVGELAEKKKKDKEAEDKEAEEEAAEKKRLAEADAANEQRATKYESAGAIKDIWNNLTFLSLRDTGRMIQTVIDFVKSNHERKSKWRIGNAGQAFPGRLGREFSVMQTGSENEAVSKYKDGMADDDVWTVLDKMHSSSDNDEVRATLQILSEKGRLRFDDIKLWRTLNRLLDKKPGGGYSKIEIHRFKDTPDKAQDQVKRALDALWGDGTGDDYFSKTINSFDSATSSFEKEAGDYENGYKGVGISGELHNMLLDHINGEQIRPERYYCFLKYIMKSGKGELEDKFYYLLMGLYAQNHRGETLLNRRLLSDLSANSNTLPFLDFLTRCRPIANKGNFPQEYLEEISKAFNIKYNRNEDSISNRFDVVAVNRYIWQDGLTHKATLRRVEKGLRGAGDIDHDDAQFIIPLARLTNMRDDVFGVSAGTKKNFMPPALRNGIAGYNMMFAAVTDVPATYEEHRGSKERTSKGFENSDEILLRMIPTYIYYIAGIAGKLSGYKGQKGDFWEQGSLVEGESVTMRQHVAEMNRVIGDVLKSYGVKDIDLLLNIDYIDQKQIPENDNGGEDIKKITDKIEKFTDNFQQMVKSHPGGSKHLVTSFRNAVSRHGLRGLAGLGPAMQVQKDFGNYWEKGYNPGG